MNAKVLIAGTAMIVALGAGFGLMIGSYQTSQHLDPDDAQLVALGSRLYARDCAVCHGAQLQGQPNWRNRLPNGTFPAPPHDATGHTWHHPDGVLIRITRDGGASVAPSGFKSNMPAFAPRLSDRDIVAVLSYIKSRWPKEIRQRHDALNARVAAQGSS